MDQHPKRLRALTVHDGQETEVFRQLTHGCTLTDVCDTIAPFPHSAVDDQGQPGNLFKLVWGYCPLAVWCDFIDHHCRQTRLTYEWLPPPSPVV